MRHYYSTLRSIVTLPSVLPANDVVFVGCFVTFFLSCVSCIVFCFCDLHLQLTLVVVIPLLRRINVYFCSIIRSFSYYLLILGNTKREFKSYYIILAVGIYFIRVVIRSPIYRPSTIKSYILQSCQTPIAWM